VTCCKYSITCQDDLLTVDNAQSHVTAFRPISEAARSWSDDRRCCYYCYNYYYITHHLHSLQVSPNVTHSCEVYINTEVTSKPLQ